MLAGSPSAGTNVSRRSRVFIIANEYADASTEGREYLCLVDLASCFLSRCIFREIEDLISDYCEKCRCRCQTRAVHWPDAVANQSALGRRKRLK